MLEEYMKKMRERCYINKLDPHVIPTFDSLSDEELSGIQNEYKDTLDIIRLFMNTFLEKCKGIPILVSVTDRKGNIIEYLGDPSMEDTVVNQVGLKKGVQFTEVQAGVNSPLAALELGIPVQVIGEEHFYHFLHQTACYSAPLFHKNQVVGTISMMTFVEVANPLIMASLETVVDSIQRELDLLEKNRYLDQMNHMVLEQSNTGYIVVEKSREIIRINPKARDILGLKQKDEPFTINELKLLSNVLDQYGKGEVIQDYKIIFQNKHETRTCLVDFFPFQEGTLIQLHDITEYMKTESYIQNAEKLAIVGQMAAGVAHEIKNPLTTLKGFVQLFKEGGTSNAFPEIMLKEIERIDQITNEFLVLSRPTVQKKDWHDVRDLISEIEVLLTSFAIIKNVDIQYDFHDVMPVYCDGNQMKQVFINLVKNSVESVGQNGKLIISVRSRGNDQLLISFSDDGNGFPDQILQRMGQPFLTTKKDGNGLGLMICKRVVEEIHNGEICIRNNSLGGAAVDVLLPYDG
ncbi:ATP-binding protein [Sutcliffiella horikoshii]|uniref:ATP-binding protein n=1 Tax=Sutcliffiella horikoshii TaxID=79883 RepID=UPI00203D91A8|nr:ATP-binding protein [Sutcliffiella horikoshii]MCM3618872.1 ATP-binding protein [Sutcliffiella horikoshii]